MWSAAAGTPQAGLPPLYFAAFNLAKACAARVSCADGSCGEHVPARRDGKQRRSRAALHRPRAVRLGAEVPIGGASPVAPPSWRRFWPLAYAAETRRLEPGRCKGEIRRVEARGFSPAKSTSRKRGFSPGAGPKDPFVPQ